MLLTDEWPGSLWTGSWERAAQVQKVREPATDDALGEVGLAEPADVRRAAELAGLAQADWAQWITARSRLPRYPF